MGFQGSLEALAKVFIGFVIACAAIGRPDIPIKVIAGLGAKALQGTTASWGCPSAFNREACTRYNPKKYR